MEPLFEAKALYAGVYALYNIYRLGTEKYKAQLVLDQNGEFDSAAPIEFVISKNGGQWETEDNTYRDLITTIGVEIDTFNHGYGALLGRIGIE